MYLYLGAERCAETPPRPGPPALHLEQRDSDPILPGVHETLARAVALRRRLEIEYLSPKYADGQCRRHVVDAFEPHYFDPGLGHYYLHAWCHYTDTPEGRVQVNAYRHFRLGRIRGIGLLPHKLPPQPPAKRKLPVVYVLSPQVARQGVSARRWITIEHIETQADGGAMVHGATISTFWAVQDLLHYGAECRVIGGPEMRRAMERAVAALTALYATDF